MSLVSADPAVLNRHVEVMATTVAGIDNVVAEMVSRLTALTDRAEENVRSRRIEYDEARRELASAENAVRTAETAVEHARHALAQAQAELERAHTERGGTDREGMNPRPADVSGSMAAVARAEAGLALATRRLDQAMGRLAEARAEAHRAEQRVSAALSLRDQVQAEVGRAQFAAARAAALRDLATSATFLLTCRVDLLDEYNSDLPSLVSAALTGSASPFSGIG